MIKLEYIREYLLLAETLNFSKAAERSYITQPAFSRHIAAVEEEMGAKLFERTTRSVWLTPAGEVVRDQFQNMLRSYDYAREQVDRLSKESSGFLTVNSPYFWDESYTEPIVLALMEGHPERDIQIETLQPDDGIAALTAGHGDVAIDMYKDNIDAAVRRVPFATEPLAVAVPEEHPLRSRSSVRLAELEGETFVALRLGKSDFGTFNSIELDLLAKRGIHPRSLVYAEHVNAIGIMCRSCGGVCIVPYGTRFSIRSYLHLVPIEDEDCILEICVYYRMDNANRLIPKFVRMACELGESGRLG